MNRRVAARGSCRRCRILDMPDEARDETDVVHAVWVEQESDTYWRIKTRQISNRGAGLGPIRNVLHNASPDRLRATEDGPSLKLTRQNGSDEFKAVCLPVVAVNPDPARAQHLYVAYPDKADDTDKADIYFVQSLDGGDSWTSPARVNTDTTVTDQWMPVLAVKPDGSKLFLAWYDRRLDTVSNSLIDVFGCWGTVQPNGTVSFGLNFRITTGSFPPVFAGTDPSNWPEGRYDPVYPPQGPLPEGLSLAWHYADWIATFGEDQKCLGSWSKHVGEYNGVTSDSQYVYLVWSDNRLAAVGLVDAFGQPRPNPRLQPDIRSVRISWP